MNIPHKVLSGRATIGEVSVDAKALIDRLLRVASLEVIPWEDLDAVVGRSVRAHGSALNRARIILRRDHRIEFDAVKGVGLKRLDSAGCVAKAHAAISACGRRGKQIARILACADYTALDAGGKQTHDAVASLAALTAHITSAPNLKKISAAASGGPLPIGHSLRELLS